MLLAETRRYLTAEWQNVVYSEFLPLVLGSGAVQAFGIDIDDGVDSRFDPNVRPDIFNEFSTAAFR